MRREETSGCHLGAVAPNNAARLLHDFQCTAAVGIFWLVRWLDVKPPGSTTSASTTGELRWSKPAVTGCICREILNVDQQAAYDPLGWQK